MGKKEKPTKNDELELPEKIATTSEEEVIYTALSNQTRRKIITFIKQQEKVGFLELQSKFRLQIGSLYHQLNMMRELWDQDENKKYFLSDLGKLAYNLMILNKDQIETSNVRLAQNEESKKKIKLREKFYTFLLSLVLPKKVFQYLATEPLRTFFEGIIIIGAMIYFSIDSGIVLIGFYPLETTEWYYSLIGILGLWLFLGIITETFKVIFYERKFNPLKLLTIIPFTLIPNMIILLFIWIQSRVTTTFLFLGGQILIILGQMWTLSLTTTAISQTRGLTLSRSSLIALFTFYLIYAISFVLFGTL